MITQEARKQIAKHVVPVPDFGLPSPAVDLFREATVVGLGATVRHATHAAAAMSSLIGRLISDYAFEAIAIEGTDPPYDTGSALDGYVTHGRGDPKSIIQSSQGFLHNREFLDFILALRAHNEHGSGPLVRIVHGAERGRPVNSLVEIEQELANQVLFWRRRTGHKVIRWGGAAHVIAADPRGISVGNGLDANLLHRNAGGHLRAALGDNYASVAVTVGEVESGSDYTAIPAAPPSFFESALQTSSETVWLTTRGTSPIADSWIDSSLRIRCVGPTYDPARDSNYYTTAPRVRGSVDGFLHIRKSASMMRLF
ncbi:erythromycin esterase family protein [Pseudonocardia sp. NPDC049635]|uniref:erythromycin esterase family protein n=1 Tax=Pseudonocardia sp. NPDC049635 TaxID=3155506 RepID=UPI0033EF0545